MECLKDKLPRFVSIMHKQKYYLPTNVNVKFIISYGLNYWFFVWSTTIKSSIYQLHTLPKKAIRIVGNLQFTAHTTNIFSAYRITLATELFGHRLSLSLCRQSSSNNFLRHLCTLSTNVIMFNTRHKETLTYP